MPPTERTSTVWRTFVPIVHKLKTKKKQKVVGKDGSMLPLLPTQLHVAPVPRGDSYPWPQAIINVWTYDIILSQECVVYIIILSCLIVCILLWEQQTIYNKASIFKRLIANTSPPLRPNIAK